MQEITISPVSIMVSGSTKAERQISVVRTASSTALTACINMKGTAGKEIRNSAATAGMVDVARHAATGNYRPLAEVLSIRTGEPILISSRATFEALGDIFQTRVYQAKLAKNGGYTTDKKTGTLVPGARLKQAQELADFVAAVHKTVAAIVAERQARTEQQAAPALKAA